MSTRLATCLTLLAVGCGYTFGAPRAPGGVERLDVAPVVEPGIDVDAAAVVASAVRTSVSRGGSISLSSPSAADALLKVELLGSAAGLEPFASPSVRATQYRAAVRIRATLVRPDGEVLWTSPIVEGRAPFLSVPDAAETLDGVRRRAMVTAASDAADQLIAAMLYGS